MHSRVGFRDPRKSLGVRPRQLRQPVYPLNIRRASGAARRILPIAQPRTPPCCRAFQRILHKLLWISVTTELLRGCTKVPSRQSSPLGAPLRYNGASARLNERSRALPACLEGTAQRELVDERAGRLSNMLSDGEPTFLSCSPTQNWLRIESPAFPRICGGGPG